MSEGKHFSSDELAQQRTSMAEKRSDMATQRTSMAGQRSDLAIQRTLMAGERTLMAWTRTSLSMITFGFTIYKFLQYMQEQGGGRLRSAEGPRRLGMALIALGVASLIIAGLQHWRFLGEIQGHKRRWGMSLFVTGAIALVGLVALMGILFKVGPF